MDILNYKNLSQDEIKAIYDSQSDQPNTVVIDYRKINNRWVEVKRRAKRWEPKNWRLATSKETRKFFRNVGTRDKIYNIILKGYRVRCLDSISPCREIKQTRIYFGYA